MKLTIKSIFIVILLSTFTLLIMSCDDSPVNPGFQETDYSLVPDPFPVFDLEPIELQSGVKYYIYAEGEADFPTVTSRDQISVYLTLRIKDGSEDPEDWQIITSSYENLREDPQTISVSNFTYGTDGFLEGVLGMQEKEKRTIVVPPNAGYGNASPNSQFYALRNDTLVYDVDVNIIFY